MNKPFPSVFHCGDTFGQLPFDILYMILGITGSKSSFIKRNKESSVWMFLWWQLTSLAGVRCGRENVQKRIIHMSISIWWRYCGGCQLSCQQSLDSHSGVAVGRKAVTGRPLSSFVVFTAVRCRWLAIMLGDQADNVREKLSVNNLFSNSPAVASDIREISHRLIGLVRQLGVCR